MSIELHEKFMKEALKEAQKAALDGDIPVGAVIVCEQKIVARGRNLREKNNDSTAHAEIVAIRRASQKLGRWNLSGCDIYVTLEPCVMCAGAVINSRIDNVFFGAYDKRFGCCGSVYDLAQDKKFNHTANVTGGILHDECAAILKNFFNELRKRER